MTTQTAEVVAGAQLTGTELVPSVPVKTLADIMVPVVYLGIVIPVQAAWGIFLGWCVARLVHLFH